MDGIVFLLFYFLHNALFLYPFVSVSYRDKRGPKSKLAIFEISVV